MRRAKRFSLWTLTVAGLLALAPVSVALGQEKIDESRDLNADGSVEITNVAGTVTVAGWDRKEVEVKGVLGKGTERLEVEGDKKRLEIKVILPKRSRHVEGTRLEIRVPKGCRLEVTTVSADVEVEKLDGKVRLQTVSGDVLAEGEPKEADVESVSGDLEILFETDWARAKSISGDVYLEGARGEVTIETVSGDIEIKGGKLDRGLFSSVSGDIHFNADVTEKGAIAFNSHSGSVELLLPKDIDAEFDVSTFSGGIDNAFGSNGKRRSKFVPGTDLNFRVGSGDARVRAETFSGDIAIHKK